jgi:hypothetical protein
VLEELSKILTPVFIGFVSAYFGSLLAIRKFKKEKLWERQEKAYTEIIDALYDMLQHCEIHKEDYGQGTGYSEEKEDEISEGYSRAHWKIKKATDIGAFVISNKAYSVLMELRNREQLEWEENPKFDIYEHEFQHFQKALREIKELSGKPRPLLTLAPPRTVRASFPAYGSSLSKAQYWTRLQLSGGTSTIFP